MLACMMCRHVGLLVSLCMHFNNQSTDPLHSYAMKTYPEAFLKLYTHFALESINLAYIGFIDSSTLCLTYQEDAWVKRNTQNTIHVHDRCTTYKYTHSLMFSTIPVIGSARSLMLSATFFSFTASRITITLLHEAIGL